MLDSIRPSASEYTLVRNLQHNNRYDLRIVRTASNETRFQKVAKSPQAGKQLEAEYQWYLFLQDIMDKSFKVPHIYDYDPCKSILLEDVQGSTFQDTEITLHIGQLINVLKYFRTVPTRSEAPVNPYFQGQNPGAFFYEQAKQAAQTASLISKDQTEKLLDLVGACSAIEGRFGHGDFQPSNIMLTETSQLCVIDGEGGGANLLPFADVGHMYYQLRVNGRTSEAAAWLQAAQVEWVTDPDFKKCLMGYLSWITIMDQARLDLTADQGKALSIQQLARDITEDKLFPPIG